jgi:hypothetical protein
MRGDRVRQSKPTICKSACHWLNKAGHEWLTSTPPPPPQKAQHAPEAHRRTPFRSWRSPQRTAGSPWRRRNWAWHRRCRRQRGRSCTGPGGGGGREGRAEGAAGGWLKRARAGRGVCKMRGAVTRLLPARALSPADKPSRPRRPAHHVAQSGGQAPHSTSLPDADLRYQPGRHALHSGLPPVGASSSVYPSLRRQ